MFNVALSPEILSDIRCAASIEEADAAIRAHGVILPRAQLAQVYEQTHEEQGLDDADLSCVGGGVALADGAADDAAKFGYVVVMGMGDSRAQAGECEPSAIL